MADTSHFARYERQVLFTALGEAGQERLAQSTVVVAGVGALGSAAADMLARAGIGRLRLIDCDIVELSNLQRQGLYDEADVAAGRPKAQIAAEKLARVNSQVEISSTVTAIDESNAAALLAGAAAVIDAVDNFKAKFALNSAALRLGIPLMYGAVSGSYGLTMPVLPGQGPCLCCLYCEEPAAEAAETAATAGVISPIVHAIAALQVCAVLQLIGAGEIPSPDLVEVDVWDREWRAIPVAKRPDCAVCGTG